MLHSYQAEHGPDFPWSVGKEGLPRPAAWRGERGRADPMVDLRPFLLRRGGHEYGWTEAAGAVPGERRSGVKGGPEWRGHAGLRRGVLQWREVPRGCPAPTLCLSSSGPEAPTQL